MFSPAFPAATALLQASAMGQKSFLSRGLMALLIAFAPTCALVQSVNAADPAPGAAKSGAPSSATWPRYVLRAEKTWQLNLPGGREFDASGLLITQSGDLLTINDRGSTLYRVEFLPGTNAANLVALPDIFTPAQLEPFKREKLGRYDSEGIARDEQGRLYICEEANRWVMRYNPATKAVERLDIDWSPVRQYFSPVDRNASFEGIAVGGGKLFLANERTLGRLITVDLETLRVVDDFIVNPLGGNARDVHYSDLSWFDGALYVLLRESRCVLQVEPRTHRVLAEYSFRDLSNEPENVYILLYPTGNMEGLAVDRDFIWLLTDNNGQGRVRHPKDTRPTLFKCRRPEARK